MEDRDVIFNRICVEENAFLNACNDLSLKAVMIGRQLRACSVRDPFDHSDDVLCPVYDAAPEPALECVRVSVVVEYEHFDAFSERGTFI